MKANFSLMLILSGFFFSGQLLLAQTEQVDKEIQADMAKIKTFLTTQKFVSYTPRQLQILDQAWKIKLEKSNKKKYNALAMQKIADDEDISDDIKVAIYVSFLLTQEEMQPEAEAMVAEANEKIKTTGHIYYRKKMDRNVKSRIENEQLDKSIAANREVIAANRDSIAYFDENIAHIDQNIIKLKNDREKLQKEYVKLQKEYVRLQKEYEKLQKENQEAEKTLAELKKINATLKWMEEQFKKAKQQKTNKKP